MAVRTAFLRRSVRPWRFDALGLRASGAFFLGGLADREEVVENAAREIGNGVVGLSMDLKERLKQRRHR